MDIKIKLFILTKIHPNEVLALPMLVNDQKKITIKHFRNTSDIGDGLPETEHWRIIDHDSKVVASVNTITEVIKLAMALGSTEEELEEIIDHQLKLIVAWHQGCMDMVSERIGESYIKDSLGTKDKVTDLLANLFIEERKDQNWYKRFYQILSKGEDSGDHPRLQLVPDMEKKDE